ncbi:hypothetical protein GXW82_36895 [Streptacidiphilus sp. 4-A2]|nr:hypothetical protein [Streptacidiphilus sp. 4-A2]
MNVSAGPQRTIPRALVLALLVGGTGALAPPGTRPAPTSATSPGTSGSTRTASRSPTACRWPTPPPSRPCRRPCPS